MSKFANSLIIHIFATLNSQVTNVENIQAIKQRFGIIGNDLKLNRALEKAIQVAPTDISVLITGESGVAKRLSLVSFTRSQCANTANISL